MLLQVVKVKRQATRAPLLTTISRSGRPLRGVDAQHRAQAAASSSKITSAQDRSREGSGAGTSMCPRAWASSCAPQARAHQPEIKRDFEYLIRSWGKTVRDRP